MSTAIIVYCAVSHIAVFIAVAYAGSANVEQEVAVLMAPILVALLLALVAVSVAIGPILWLVGFTEGDA